MSQAKNKVQWCLNKAKRELAENGLHRGLVEVSSNAELARKHLAKAKHKGVIDLEEGFVNMLLISKAKEIDLSIIKIREEFQYGIGFLYENRKLFDASLKACQSLMYSAQKIVDQT